MQWLLVVSWGREYSHADIVVNRRSNTDLGDDICMNSMHQRLSVGERIKLRRKALRLTQVQVAAISGVEQPTISDLERGTTKAPAGHTLVGLCRALQTSARWLLEGKGEPTMVYPRSESEEEALSLFNSLTPEERELWVTLGEAIRNNRRPPEDDQPSPRHLLPQ